MMMKKKYIAYAFAVLFIAWAVGGFVSYVNEKNADYHARPLEGFMTLTAEYEKLPGFIKYNGYLQRKFSEYITSLPDAVEPSEVTEARMREKNGYRIIAFGDSTTAASNLPMRKIWWASILQYILDKKHPDLKAEVINAGIPGTSIRHAAARLERDVLSLKPDCVTISFGLNDGQLMTFDGKTLYPFISFEEYHDTLKTIVERIVNEAHCPVILWTPPRVGTGYASERGKDAQARQKESHARMRDLLRQVARETNQPLADVEQAMENHEWPDTLTDKDEYHPGPSAQPLMAETIYKVWLEEVAKKSKQ